MSSFDCECQCSRRGVRAVCRETCIIEDTLPYCSLHLRRSFVATRRQWIRESWSSRAGRNQCILVFGAHLDNAGYADRICTISIDVPGGCVYDAMIVLGGGSPIN